MSGVCSLGTESLTLLHHVPHLSVSLLCKLQSRLEGRETQSAQNVRRPRQSPHPQRNLSLNWDLCTRGNLDLETAKLPLTFSKTKTDGAWYPRVGTARACVARAAEAETLTLQVPPSVFLS